MAGAFLTAMIAILGLDGLNSAKAAGAGQNAPITIAIDDGQVTLKVQNATLERVLTTLAQRAGFALDVQGQLTEKVSDSFDGLTPRATIRRLAGHHSYIIEFARGKDSSLRVKRLSVIAREASPRKPAARKPNKKRDRRRSRRRMRGPSRR